MTKQISTKQFVALLFLMAIAMKMFLLPALMLRVVGKDSYLVMLAYIVVESLSLVCLLITAMRNPDKTLFDILSDAFGRIISRVIVTLFALFCFLRCVLMISELKMFFTTTMYEQMNWVIMTIPLMVLLFAFSVRTLRSIGRTSELLLPIILVSTLLLSTLLLGDMNLSALLPVLENGLKPVVKGIVTFPMWYGDTAVLLLVLGNVKISKGFVAWSFVGKAVASVLTLLFSSTLFATYANISTLIDYGNNVSNMTQFSLGSQDYGRFDLLFYCVWLFSVFISLALVFRALTRSVEFVIAKKRHTIVSAVCVIVLYIVSAFVLRNENTVYNVMTTWIKYLAYPVAALLPFVVLLAALIKYKPNYHRNGGENGAESNKKEE